MTDFTICLTGHTGYIGSHFVAFLIERGYSPYLIGRRGIETVPLSGCKASNLWDNSAQLTTQLKEVNNPIIINMAGYFASDHKSANYFDLIDSNFCYPLSVMEAVSDLKDAKIVNIGTTWEYDELGNKTAENLYAQLKACNSSVADWYARNYAIRTINLKLNDTFGGNDTREKLMPMLKSHYTDGTVAHLKFSAQIINLLHIADVCEGLLCAANRTNEVSPYNSETAFLLANESVSLFKLVERINALGPRELYVKFQDELPREHRLKQPWKEAPLLKGWQPNLNLDEALEEYFIESGL